MYTVFIIVCFLLLPKQCTSNLNVTHIADVYTTAEGTWNGTDTDVYLTIHGTSGSTERIKLDKWMNDDLQPLSVGSYQLKSKDTGEILFLILEKEGKDDRDVGKIVITNTASGNKTTCAHYDLILDNPQMIRCGKPLLPFQETNEAMKEARRLEIERRQERYQFKPNNSGLPGRINAEKREDLPRSVQFLDRNVVDFKHKFEEAKEKFGNSSLDEEPWEKPEDLADIARRYSSGVNLRLLENYVKRWDSDDEYAHFLLAGPNPEMIQKCDRLPDNFPVTDSMVEHSLTRNLSLSQEIEKGNVFILNYKDLAWIDRYSDGEDKRYVANAMVLLYVPPSRHLVPIAIKLDQEDGPIWTPEDGLAWTLAKLHAKNADAQIQQMYTHMMKTHLVLEPLCLSLQRHLSKWHPLFQMMKYHCRGVITANTLGKRDLLGPAGAIERTLSVAGNGNQWNLMKRMFRTRFQCSDLNLPQFFAKRGTDSQDKLPFYPYRDDALLIWNTLKDKLVSEYVRLYYKTDNDVAFDDELQNFMKETHFKGFPSEDGDLDKQWPETVQTRDGLITLLTMIINIVPQYAAVNYPQFDAMSFPPNYPLSLRQPPPDHKGAITMADVMAALPNKELALNAVAMAYAFSRYPDNAVYFGDYSEGLITDEGAKNVLENFKDKLASVSAQIKARNDNREVKYPYLLPEWIPASIAT